MSQYVLVRNARLASSRSTISRTATLSVQQRAPDDLVRGVIATHGVDGNLHLDFSSATLSIISRDPRLLLFDGDDLLPLVSPTVGTDMVRQQGLMALGATGESG